MEFDCYRKGGWRGLVGLILDMFCLPGNGQALEASEERSNKYLELILWR